MSSDLVWVCMKDGPSLVTPDGVLQIDVSCERTQGHDGWHHWSADDGEAKIEWTDGWTWDGLTRGAWRDDWEADDE